MANDLNQCNFIGRLGADPETRHLQSGDAVTNFRIACGWKTKEKEGAEWISIVTFGKLAEICGEYLRKGAQVFVSGRFQTRKWTDQNGVDRYTSEIVADKMQMLGSKSENGGHNQSTQQRNAAPAQQQPQGGPPDYDDDIPF